MDEMQCDYSPGPGRGQRTVWPNQRWHTNPRRECPAAPSCSYDNAEKVTKHLTWTTSGTGAGSGLTQHMLKSLNFHHICSLNLRINCFLHIVCYMLAACGPNWNPHLPGWTWRAWTKQTLNSFCQQRRKKDLKHQYTQMIGRGVWGSDFNPTER